MTETEPLRILIFGAHPDDCEFFAGGITALYTRLGHQVKLVSLTNGDAGGHDVTGPELARIRRAEAAEAALALGAESLVLDHPDGTLMPTFENRCEVIKIIREYRPDLVMVHRTNDYHPDHRYTGVLVQDAINMVIVSHILPDVPSLMYIPVLAYLWDPFQRPYAFVPDVVVDIDPVYEQKIEGLNCHTSQVYGLIWGIPEVEPPEYRDWLKARAEADMVAPANLYRQQIIQTYGPERGEKIHYIEAFEISEYGAKLTQEKRERFFPFLPK